MVITCFHRGATPPKIKKSLKILVWKMIFVLSGFISIFR